MRRLISSGSPFEGEAGYSRAVVDGEWIFVAGTTGFDYAAMTIVEDSGEQARQAFRNIEQALAEAGASHIYLAGRPGSNEAAWRAAGVNEFVFVGCDALAILQAAFG